MPKNKKTIGGVTTYQRLGKEVSRPSRNEVGNVTRSENQDLQRRRWYNAINLWRAFVNDGWKPRFQEKAPGQTDYARFTSYALQGTTIYLTMQQGREGGCVLVPVMVSVGSLPTIKTHFDGVGVTSDIRVGNFVITPQTTVSQLVRAIIYNNSNILKGDSLTFVAGDQQVRPSDNMPVVLFRHCRLDLDPRDSRLLSSLRGSDEAFTIRDGLLASTVSQGACTWVQSRPGSLEQYSTQELWCGNDEMIQRYHSREAYEASSQSYGGIHPNGILEPDALPDDMAGRQ